MDDNPDIEIHASREDLDLMFHMWPENFSSMFDMGLRSFERLFNHRPQLKSHFNLPIDDETWRRDERIKKIVLTLEQTLAKAVATFADPEPESTNTSVNFSRHLQEVGGLHRAIVPNIPPDNYELLFKLLPEVIVDVTSSRRREGPLSASERQRLLLAWCQVAALMSRQFMLGWVRRVVPTTPKFNKIYSQRRTSLVKQDAAPQETPQQPQEQVDEERRKASFLRVIAPIAAVRKMK